MKEGGTLCVMKKMGDKRERRKDVRDFFFKGLQKLLKDWRWGMKGKEKGEVEWELERVTGIDGFICHRVMEYWDVCRVLLRLLGIMI
jgi:hypothetical protein